ncbi:MAG: MBL fold metallo-hydrolase [Chloroflexi bacterium]|jgi:glyoxylase-like metal-dependent hydrolase (beta-lactamase superfamily II)|nr:MBL fold metallo-hydrolase [Chloroflexota bacterium]
MFQIGEIEIYPVSAGLVQVDGGGAFGLVPRVLWSRYLPPDDQNRVPMTLTCLLVRAAGKTIVVDTGMGDKLPPKLVQQWGLTHPRGTLLDGLARMGIQPEDVDIVINTHLHSDHCAGNTTVGPDGELRATFPRAEYVVQRREYEDAIRPNERTRATYVPFNYEPLYRTGQLTLLDGDTEIAPGVRAVVTPGHTPAHQVVVFESGGQHALFVADLASYAVHFERLGWMTAYDVEPLVTLETKRHWQRWALDHDALLIFQHDTQKGAGHLHADAEGHPIVRPVEVVLA